MVNKNFLNQLKKLKIPLTQYAIFGSGPMAARNIRDCRDLDIVVTDSQFKKLLADYPETKPGNIRFGNGIEIWSEKESLLNNPGRVIARADTIDGFRYISLDDLLIWKKKMGRPKDLKDIELINKYIACNSSHK